MNTSHDRRPAGSPAYFLGRPAAIWLTAQQRQRARARRVIRRPS